MHYVPIHDVSDLIITQRIKLSSYPNGQVFLLVVSLLLSVPVSVKMDSLNGEGAMEILYTTLPADDVDLVFNIEPAGNMHPNHAPGSPRTSDDSASDDNLLRRPSRASSSN